MALRTVANDRLVDGAKLDLISVTIPIDLDDVTTTGDLALKVDKTTTVNGHALSSNVVLTTADISDSSNRRYVTDSELGVLGNTSGTNTGDETQGSIKTKLGAASAGVDGYLTGTDWSTFNNKQATLVSGTNIKTISSHSIVGAGDLALVKGDVGLGNVENTALSTWPGTTNITTLGTIATGVWNGSVIDIADGGTGEASAQDAINALTQVSGATNEYVLTKDTVSGNALWKAATGFTWGSSITGTTGTGVTLTLGSNYAAGGYGQKIVFDNTQTSALIGLNIDTGTSNFNHIGINMSILKNFGLAINAFNTVSTQAVAPVNALYIGGTKYNDNSSTSSVLAIFTIANNAGAGRNSGIQIVNNNINYDMPSLAGAGLMISQAGGGGTAFVIRGNTNTNSTTNGLVNFTITNTQSGASVVQKIDLGTSAQAHNGLLINAFNANTGLSAIKIETSTTGTGIPIEFSTSGTGRKAFKAATGFTGTAPAGTSTYLIIDIGGTEYRILAQATA